MGWGEAHVGSPGTSKQIEEVNTLLDKYGVPPGDVSSRIKWALTDIESRITPVLLAIDPSWAPTAAKNEPVTVEDLCRKCGGRNVTSWNVDSDRWNIAFPDDMENNRIVCPGCFVEAHEAATGLVTTWRLMPDMFIRATWEELQERAKSEEDNPQTVTRRHVYTVPFSELLNKGFEFQQHMRRTLTDWGFQFDRPITWKDDMEKEVRIYVQEQEEVNSVRAEGASERGDQGVT